MINDKKISDDMLDNVIGGVGVDKKTAAVGTAENPQDPLITTKLSDCPVCKRDTTFNLYLGGRAICQECGNEKFM